MHEINGIYNNQWGSLAKGAVWVVFGLTLWESSTQLGVVCTFTGCDEYLMSTGVHALHSDGCAGSFRQTTQNSWHNSYIYTPCRLAGPSHPSVVLPGVIAVGHNTWQYTRTTCLHKYIQRIYQYKLHEMKYLSYLQYIACNVPTMQRSCPIYSLWCLVGLSLGICYWD